MWKRLCQKFWKQSSCGRRLFRDPSFLAPDSDEIRHYNYPLFSQAGDVSSDGLSEARKFVHSLLDIFNAFSSERSDLKDEDVSQVEFMFDNFYIGEVS